MELEKIKPPKEQISVMFNVEDNQDKSNCLYGDLYGLSYDYWRL